jgi:hypothetical protein
MNLVFANGQSAIQIFGKNYLVVDALENITLADSFVKNKIGTGHGEGKLYIGQQGKPESFFENMDSADSFFLKKDFISFLQDAKTEFDTPQQNYQQKEEMNQIYIGLFESVLSLQKESLHFQIYRVPVIPPRVYINSNSIYFDLMRKVGLPNISYLSILKLKDMLTNKVSFYFRIFIDYKNDIVLYNSPKEKKQLDDIETSMISARKKQILANARIGQGEYREKLLEECSFCPFTMVNDERLLIASHIKPWVDSNDDEKIDPKNGFTFTPTYDKLFDKGFISFDDNKNMLVSPWLSPMNQKRLDIYSGKKIDKLPLDSKRANYLKYHREHVFKS